MTTAEHIPFINSAKDCTIAKLLYSDATAMRVSLESIGNTGPYLPSGPKRWVDPSIDGLHHKNLSKLSDKYIAHVKKFVGYAQVADPQFQQNPDKQIVEQFIFSVLDYCKAHAPDWISVPQLPLVNDTGRNKINRLLAEKTKLWKVKTSYAGKLILPAIFTNQNQLNKKTERNKKIASILNCFALAGGDGVWAVDSSLNDQEGSGKFDERFPALKNFHEELNQKLAENAVTICGPYWGMNLVLWSRGTAHFPAIGLGGSYKYNIPGVKLPKGKDRVALRPLRRWAIASPQLKNWLTDTVANLSPNDPARPEFASIEKDFSKLQISANGKMQIASFYKNWFDKFASLPPAGRALALYQDLSSSYILGKTLKNLPNEEGTARRPERVAQQLMMNCL
jgi:hypothetical protein